VTLFKPYIRRQGLLLLFIESPRARRALTGRGGSSASALAVTALITYDNINNTD
jgi:hypothetical protein